MRSGHVSRGSSRPSAVGTSPLPEPRAGIRAASLLIAIAVPCLGTPLAAQTIARCPADMDPSLTGLAGVVRDSAESVIIPGARVLAVWAEDAGGRLSQSVETDDRGVYLLCNLPAARSLTIQASFASFATAPRSVTVAPGPPAGWDFRLAVEADALFGLSTVPGRIMGRVLDRTSGRPVEAASLVLVGEEDRQRFSDGSGRYAFGDLAPGIYRLMVEHLAFENLDQLVNLPSDRTLEVNFELSIDPIELEPLVVTAVREKRLELQGFYERREISEAIGAGIFLTREDIRNAGAIRVTQFLGRIQGIRTECSGRGNNNCTIRMTRGAPSLSRRAEYGCVNTNVYVDGIRVIRDGTMFDSIDNFVSPSEIAGIEVYRGPSELPAEFGGSVGRCGAIVIWTGPAGAKG